MNMIKKKINLVSPSNYTRSFKNGITQGPKAAKKHHIAPTLLVSPYNTYDNKYEVTTINALIVPWFKPNIDNTIKHNKKKL